MRSDVGVPAWQHGDEGVGAEVHEVDGGVVDRTGEKCDVDVA